MAAPFSSASLFGIREEDQNQMKQQHSSTTTPSSSSTPAAPPPQKKRRNQPGTPSKNGMWRLNGDPDAEVIALSPKTLMATNRFICEVCNKGFQREQNLQLHRRGHNLPWKLKQKSNKEPKRKVYLCPEPTCVHHDPSRALGDLTGIKKHYSRKHGEKKWKCDKCSKKYAVQSDWKAHSKTCGTREYRCDCGTLFSSHAAENWVMTDYMLKLSHHTPNYSEEHHFNPTEASNFFTEGTIIGIDHQTSSATAPSLFSTTLQNTTNLSHMSATALLQKAAQMGAASSSTNNSASSLLRSLASKSDHRPLISAANYSNILNSSVQEMMNLPGFEAYDHGITNKEPKLSVGGSDRLTRDFLGVAQQQQQQQRGFNLSSLEAETNNAAASGQSFGGGANFQ
ncbi:hypothetical protein LR48_Vigan06g146500 [Vigna angularis]|uniref:C2H2-type domain-containing protein n=1 Tax=Phaseolus angularis TaxID=3914 RepID=A0A0L9UUE8_PHAAN|nr:hypothetical protein LR48_Vigan06g146500 [Vigna angularis]